MKRILALAVCLMMLVGVAGAEPMEEHAEELDAEEYAKKLERCVKYYNTHTEKVPNYIRKLSGNDRINIYILNGDKTVLTRGIQTKEAVVVKFQNEHFEKPDMTVYIQQSLINKVINEDERSANKEKIKKALAKKDSGEEVFQKEYKEACDSGELRCVSHTTKAKIKMFVLNLLMI